MRSQRSTSLVVGVDTGRYVATLAALPEACHRLFNDVDRDQ